ncbi:hypothetical protein [Pectobacterium brasiliense]|uniref:hypothetical protein n=1 Tax=Pectobacterium brasiliense TaxID=180957 RepID=UPI001F079E4C|nr:hypothetical protein [Pectobacterium brasiliense]
MSEILSKEVHDYIINERRKLKKSRKHGYLFVTIKSGPTQGDAISINSYHRIIGELRKSSPKLSTLTGHKLRHSWNNNFSNLMDESDKVGEDEQEKIRSYSMGWKSGSGMANIYNERFIRDKANDAAIIMQNGY